MPRVIQQDSLQRLPPAGQREGDADSVSSEERTNPRVQEENDVEDPDWDTVFYALHPSLQVAFADYLVPRRGNESAMVAIITDVEQEKITAQVCRLFLVPGSRLHITHPWHLFASGRPTQAPCYRFRRQDHQSRRRYRGNRAHAWCY